MREIKEPRTLKELSELPEFIPVKIRGCNIITDPQDSDYQSLIYIVMDLDNFNSWWGRKLIQLISIETSTVIHGAIDSGYRTKIDLYRQVHKKIKKALRRYYAASFPVKFGYALRSPADMHDPEFAARVALERLHSKVKRC